MKKLLLICVVIININSLKAQNATPELIKYVSFLGKENISAKDYILSLFKDHDVVVLCERHHGEMTQYDLILDVVSSDYFIKNVGNIFTEIGAVDRREDVLNFTKTKFKTNEEKTRRQIDLYRNLAYPIWEMTNFYDFIGRINTLNSTLKKEKKINLLVSNNRNPTVAETASTDSFKKYFNGPDRDSTMANNIITTFDRIYKSHKRKKCLVIMNYRHAFSKTLLTGSEMNVGHYLINRYKSKFANVYINSVAPTITVAESAKDKPVIFQDMTEIPIQNGKWDASFKILGKENLGFTFSDSPFGRDKFDIWPYSKNDYTYADIFTGFVYYLPIPKHIHSFGIPNITDDGYIDELLDRYVVFNKAINRKPPAKEDLKLKSKVIVESYDDLKNMQAIIDQWIKK